MDARSKRKRHRKANLPLSTQEPAVQATVRPGRWLLVGMLLGGVLGAGIVFVAKRGNALAETSHVSPAASPEPVVVREPAVCRTVDQLIDLSDEQLDSVDLVELNLAVARGIPGLEGLNLGKYQRQIDTWAQAIQSMTAMADFPLTLPDEQWKENVGLLRLSAMVDYLDREVRRASISNKEEESSSFKDTGKLFIFGPIDNGESTRLTRLVLYAAIGRRIGWPLGISDLGTKLVLRFDDGQKAHTIDTTDADKSGFVIYSEQELAKTNTTPKPLNNREILGQFLQIRSRYFEQLGEWQEAEKDILLAHTLCPNGRRIFEYLLDSLLRRGKSIYSHRELAGLAHAFAYRASGESTSVPKESVQRNPREEIKRVMEINAANRQRRESVFRRPTPGVPRANRPGVQQ